jgi:protein gp37
MGENSKISWTDHTFNPWWGCTKVNTGCSHCYAEILGNRFGVKWGVSAERRRFLGKHWNEPLKWNRNAEQAGVPARVFCGSMCDVFEDRADLDGERVRLWKLTSSTPWLRWLLLTKRPKNIARMVPWGSTPPKNVALLVSVSDQRTAEELTPDLLLTPAAMRGVSLEPMVGPVDLRYLQPGDPPTEINALEGTHGVLRPHGGTCAKLDWIVCGGESGPNARPCHVEWIRSVVRQCAEAKVPCWNKQLGRESRDSNCMIFPLRDRAGADPYEWPADLRVRQRPVGW